MNTNRIYLVDQSNQESFNQTEVARSAPNDLMPLTEWEIPPEFEVVKVKVQVGYGNTDTFVYCNRIPDDPTVMNELKTQQQIKIEKPERVNVL